MILNLIIFVVLGLIEFSNATLITGCVKEYTYKTNDIIKLCSPNFAYQLSICKYSRAPIYGFCVRSVMTGKVTHHINSLSDLSANLDVGWPSREIGIAKLNHYDNNGVTMMLIASHADIGTYVTFHRTGSYKYTITDNGELRYHTDNVGIVVSGSSSDPNWCLNINTYPTVAQGPGSVKCYWTSRTEELNPMKSSILNLISSECQVSTTKSVLMIINGTIEDDYKDVKYQKTISKSLKWERINPIDPRQGYVGSLSVSGITSYTYGISPLGQGELLNEQSIKSGVIFDESETSAEIKSVYIKANSSTTININKITTKCERKLDGQASYYYPDFLDSLFDNYFEKYLITHTIISEDIE